MVMTVDELRAVMARRGLTQAQAGWMCGMSMRHMRKLANGESPIPAYVMIILTAYDAGLLPAEWLVRTIPTPVP
jgi:hypothetical protein